MKLINQFGTRFVGTIGKAMTAATWKGRNYIRGYRKPHNPQTAPQILQRDRMRDGSSEYHDLNAAQKDSYKLTRTMKRLKITAFNDMMKVYIDQSVAGEEYEPSPYGYVKLRDAVSGAPIEGHFVIFYTESQTHVLSSRTYEDGNSTILSFVVHEEPYLIMITAVGYVTYRQDNLTAAELLTTFGLQPT